MPQSPDDDRPEGRPDDATQPYRPPTDPWEESASTEERWVEPHEPPGPETPPHQPASEGPAPGETPPQEPTPDTERWTARANVRQPVPQEYVEEEDPYQGRSWFTPVIVGIVGLLLFGALSVGLYLIYNATKSGENAPGGPGPVPTTGSSAVPSPTQETSSAAPTSSPPATSSAPPAAVTVPRLRGDSLAEATVKLEALGLGVAVERQVDGSLPPGEVLETRPGAGESVQPGGTVTVVVAMAPTRSPSPAATAS
ncbi:PASTA domain-containing protein [Dactylosporangium sp. AC04546]|uniref:PASTA domain-containing protein n=1 Tax=Dactylosporangium sp. AC04546 TaxID=2862460 RepID=UPI001EE0F73D|nr:PASTA domain-containing protein [Dactylosporangium sp. AC04546]WVK83919.1 PASTA domain-containing protein [Dactylosporangium sp. AC04546]